ncbi:homoserine dehydrogenase [Ereboglobus luteus]|uniref:Homoserine dehydrogenase n=1 Tax=Ereboglobus luteus TaxID=1796921 RepID=A0A2U8E5T0_9BACT|nr:homoserine dehydrogenase [Ereboglobus luteus]AWI09914.1 homoserine dehydrogenase [Ereboglobus luteus]
MEQINIGMIGGGTVGSGVFRALEKNSALMTARLGVKLKVAKVAVKAFDEPRPYKIPVATMTTDWTTVVNDPKIQVVIELMGGTGLAKTVVLAALKLGKPVITANKALISKCGPELFAAAAKNNTNLYYEASVAGGIPIIKTIREALVGNRFTQIYGIVNGTCNYILTRMKNERAEFAEILGDAQKLGYAEAEPSLDVDGYDAMHKTHILASLAHGFWVDEKKILVEGIRSISQTDIQFAEKLGYTIKQLGIVKAAGAGKSEKVQISVYPALIPQQHVLANVNDVFNAVFVRGDIVGDTLYYGRGAGKDATASAVLGDIADAATDLVNGTPRRVPAFVDYGRRASVMPASESVSQFYIRLGVQDKPGVLARVAAIFRDNKISIASVVQPENPAAQPNVPLIIMTHACKEASLQKALKRIARLSEVKAKPVLLRVEHFE